MLFYLQTMSAFSNSGTRSTYHTKQISGASIPIISFEVNPNALTITMVDSKKAELIAAFTAFTVQGTWKTLWEFKKLKYWVNWTLNVFPHLWPALCQLYHKIIGKTWLNAPIWVNNAIRHKLLWFIHHVQTSNGIHMLKSVEWSPYNRMATTLTRYTDASGIGRGIWFPGKHTSF